MRRLICSGLTAAFALAAGVGLAAPAKKEKEEPLGPITAEQLQTSENNQKLIEKMPKLYAPVRGKADAGMTFYQAFGGSNGWLKPGARIPASFPDGTSNTFVCAEAAKPVIWTKPEDMVFNGKDVPALGGMFDGKFHAAMGD